MQNAVPISFAGNLTGDPDLRFAAGSGQAVVRFTVAFNPRVRDQSGEWTNGEPSFYQCSAFGPMAERVTESFSKGDRVCVLGRLEQRTWVDEKTNEKRSAFQVVADEVGASVAFSGVKVERNGRRGDDVPPPPEWANASKTRPTGPPADQS